MERVRACVVGATGYAGVEVCRLVLGHPALELTMATDRKEAGTRLDRVYPSLAGCCDVVLSLPEPDSIAAAADSRTPSVPISAYSVVTVFKKWRTDKPPVYRAAPDVGSV